MDLTHSLEQELEKYRKERRSMNVGKHPDEIGKDKKWQNGPEFLYEEDPLWSIKQSCKYTQLPEQSHPIFTMKSKTCKSLELYLILIGIHQMIS